MIVTSRYLVLVMMNLCNIYVSKKRREDGMAEGERVGGWGEDKR
jgi:hypothetical protein